jgi:hypothetical protein
VNSRNTAQRQRQEDIIMTNILSAHSKATLVRCIQIGHTYGPHELTDHCMTAVPADAVYQPGDRVRYAARGPMRIIFGTVIKRDELPTDTVLVDFDDLPNPAWIDRCERRRL